MLLEVTTTNYNLYGTICIVAGIAFSLIVGRRKFYRRNSAGMEEYKNYSSAVANGCLNKMMRLIGVFLIFLGIMFRFMGCMRPIVKQNSVNQTQEKHQSRQ
ncbi:MAG: hypothetical protein DI598_05745 [Pseudopedobacter saltans]|uniref:Molybdenum ABC transporter permease n=1 Tax=Pseudopedobacter saltans TaxID=151895 RepID=A0A2W5F7Y0_9SPHI|nr:MAG: hypothetical protein DI598_05745 [Pseudopedobacter saltans]